MTRWVIVSLVIAGCDGEATTTVDAAVTDAIDGSIKNHVACGDLMTSCPVPDQLCCDVMTGTDTCVAAGGACSGQPMQCDGPEDCPAPMECCLFQPGGSRCTQAGICGTTGVQSDRMCHAVTDCAGGQDCCGTAPGPAVDVYSICRSGGCPL